ncbi:MAG: hypothetical protein ACLRWP_06350 [Bilophila wadsworthia]
MNTTVLERSSRNWSAGFRCVPLSGGDNMRYAAQVHPFTDEHPGPHSSCSPKAGPLVLSPSLWPEAGNGHHFDVRAYPGSLMPRTPPELAAFSARGGYLHS